MSILTSEALRPTHVATQLTRLCRYAPLSFAIIYSVHYVWNEMVGRIAAACMHSSNLDWAAGVSCLVASHAQHSHILPIVGVKSRLPKYLWLSAQLKTANKVALKLRPLKLVEADKSGSLIRRPSKFWRSSKKSALAIGT